MSKNSDLPKIYRPLPHSTELTRARIWPRAKERDDGRMLRHVQRLHLSNHFWHLLEREWFKESLDPPPDQYMVRLLLLVYFYDITGNWVSKKYASGRMGVADIKTARKYIARAEELGLLTAIPSEEDKRIEQLHVTERLEAIIEQELLALFDEERKLMHALLEGPLPDTGAPLLFGADSPELASLKLTKSAGRGLGPSVSSPKQAVSRAKRRSQPRKRPKGKNAAGGEPAA